VSRATRELGVLAMAGALLAACSSAEQPARAAFLQNSDEIDQSTWSTLCGPRSDKRSPVDGDPIIEFGDDSYPPVWPMTSCLLFMDAGDPAILEVALDVHGYHGAGYQAAREVVVPRRDLLAALLPPEAWPYVLMVSESTRGDLDVAAYGFTISGGYRASATGSVSWSLRISTSPGGDAVRAERRADIAAIHEAVRDAEAQAQLLEAFTSPVRTALSRVLHLDVADVASRSHRPSSRHEPSCCHRDERDRQTYVDHAIHALEQLARYIERKCDTRITLARLSGARDRRRTIARLVAIDEQISRQTRELGRRLALLSDDELILLGLAVDADRLAKVDIVLDALVALPLDEHRARTAAAHSSR
jgi:hypothetical protein